jgi:hypothetical protein
MTSYDDSDRLTLGELSAWTRCSVAELQELEAEGVIERDAGGLFPLPETTARLADRRVATWSGIRDQLALLIEYGCKRALLAVLRLVLRLKRALTL